MVVIDPQLSVFLQDEPADAGASVMRCQNCGKRLRVIRGLSTRLQLLVDGVQVAISVSTCSKQHVVVLSWKAAASTGAGLQVNPTTDGQGVVESVSRLQNARAGMLDSISTVKTWLSWDHGLRTLRRLIWLVPVTIYWLRWLLGIENER